MADEAPRPLDYATRGLQQWLGLHWAGWLIVGIILVSWLTFAWQVIYAVLEK